MDSALAMCFLIYTNFFSFYDRNGGQDDPILISSSDEVDSSVVVVDDGKNETHLHGNTSLPFYDKSASDLTLEELVRHLLTKARPSLVCKSVPYDCKQNATFFINSCFLDHEEDYKADELGSWRNHGNKKYKVKVSSLNETVLVEQVDEHSTRNPGIYTLQKTYFVHSQDSSFKKRAYQLRDWKNKLTKYFFCGI